MEGACNFTWSYGQRKVLAGARAHEADRLFYIGLRRIDHHAGGGGGADSFDEIEDKVGVAVDIEEHNVVLFPDSSRQFFQIGWEGRKFPDMDAIACGKNGLEGIPATVVGANQGDGLDTFDRSVGSLAGVLAAIFAVPIVVHL
jgi:hypothetical protein